MFSLHEIRIQTLFVNVARLLKNFSNNFVFFKSREIPFFFFLNHIKCQLVGLIVIVIDSSVVEQGN